MTELMAQIAQNIFGSNATLATIFMALLPLVELKGSIPFGMSEDIWGNAHMLTAWQAFLWSILAEIVLTVVLAFIFKPIYNAIKDKRFFKGIVHFLTDSLNEKNKDLEKSSTNDSENKKFWKKFSFVLTFTALPIPGTGVYTGTALGILVGLGRSMTILSVTIGNILAGAIIMTICNIFPEISTILFFIFIALIIIMLIYKIVVHVIKSKKGTPDGTGHAKIISEDDLWEVVDNATSTNLQTTQNADIKNTLDKSGFIFDGKQKLTIIKLKVKDSKIEYYDEATSVLDKNSIKNIKSTLDNLAGKTILVTTPKSSTIIDCDKVMLLSNGNIIVQKKHNDI